MLIPGRIWRGEVPLVQAFWLWGVVALVVLTVAGPYVLLRLAAAGVGGVVLLGFLFAAALVVYQVTVSVGVWRSAGRYAGPKAWVLLARVAVVVSIAIVALNVVLAVFLFIDDSHDPSRSSANVAATLSRSPEYPLTGFWKNACAEDFGLAIEATTEPKIYSVIFCGPGGCFKPGTYRPNTTIVDDPKYRVVDNETIEVQGSDGFSRYVRCQ